MIFHKPKQNTYDKVFKLFMDRSKRRREGEHYPDDNYSHIFLAVNNYDVNEPPYYSTSILNNNFPELVERLIWEHLLDISNDRLTDDEICAHYNWILKKISDIAAEKRLEKES